MTLMLRQEWRWVLSVAVLTLAASSIPMATGYMVQTSEVRFAGVVYDVEDYFSHLARMRLGARGEYVYRSLFTPEPHRSEPMVYNDILLGFIASLLKIPFRVIYEISRLVGGLAVLLVAYQFVAGFLPQVSTRRLAFVMAIASTGFGWLLITQPAFSFPNQSPIEFWLADGYLFFSIMGFHHFGWSIAALLGACMAWQAYKANPRPAVLLWLAIFSALLGLNQVFELILLDVVIGIDSLYHLSRNRQALKPIILAGVVLALLHFAIVWPYLNAAYTSLFFQVWLQQNRTLSPLPHYFLLGYGLLWPLALLGLAWAWRRREARLAFPALWLGVVSVLIYFPTGTQYRWLEGISVILAIFAAIGLESVAIPFIVSRLPPRWDRPRVKWWVAALVVIATMPSTLYLIAGNALLAATHWDEAFFTRSQVAAMAWLAANTDPDDTVLAGPKMGNAIPGWIGHRVFCCHWAETMYYAQKKQQITEFFSTMPDQGRQNLLQEYGVRYVLIGPEEQKWEGFEADNVSYLRLRYREGDTAIYEVMVP